MFCPKCGNKLIEDAKECSNCGIAINNAEEAEQSEISHANNEQHLTPKTTKKSNFITTKLIVFPALAIIILLMCFIGANSISNSGEEIMQISSVGGKTLEEAYYRELGSLYSGYANIARAVGIFMASVLIGLGVKK